ncbi:MAG: hypothetical protein D6689_18560 [Deltaproteobacteria bacterium]|nr:MAG: hypothetical protein D6689_18560 [Deltaproteobacteria bacterium]
MIGRVLAVALAAVVAAACTGDAPRSVTQLAEPADALDEDLMAALLQAKNLHHKANLYLLDGDTRAAIDALRAILAIEFPPGADEAQDVLVDARSRLAKVLLGAGRADEALRVVDEGIAAAARESYFLANAYTVRGEILEHLATAQTDPAARDALKRDAIAAYDRSIEINNAIRARLREEARR